MSSRSTSIYDIEPDAEESDEHAYTDSEDDLQIPETDQKIIC